MESKDANKSNEIEMEELNQQYLDQKLSLDVYKIPILYLKWFLDHSHIGHITI